jgi:hypothetical protein
VIRETIRNIQTGVTGSVVNPNPNPPAQVQLGVTSPSTWMQPSGAGIDYVWPLKWVASDTFRGTLQQWYQGDPSGSKLNGHSLPLKNIEQYLSTNIKREQHFKDEGLIKLASQQWMNWGKKRISDVKTIVQIREEYDSDTAMSGAFQKQVKGKWIEMTASAIRIKYKAMMKAIRDQGLG